MNGIMEKRCRRCQDGLVTLFGAGGRKVVTCSCSRGQERDAVAQKAPVAHPVQHPPPVQQLPCDEDLKARLLEAFRGLAS